MHQLVSQLHTDSGGCEVAVDVADDEHAEPSTDIFAEVARPPEVGGVNTGMIWRSTVSTARCQMVVVG